MSRGVVARFGWPHYEVFAPHCLDCNWIGPSFHEGDPRAFAVARNHVCFPRKILGRLRCWARGRHDLNPWDQTHVYRDEDDATVTILTRVCKTCSESEIVIGVDCA